VHLIYIDIGKKMVINNTLFSSTGDVVTDERNRMMIMEIIYTSIDMAISQLIPINYVIDRYEGPNEDLMTTIAEEPPSNITADISALSIAPNNTASILTQNIIEKHEEKPPVEVDTVVSDSLNFDDVPPKEVFSNKAYDVPSDTSNIKQHVINRKNNMS
jgi:hypothetical protein